MRDDEIHRSEDIVGWPDHHFAGHRKRFAGFDASRAERAAGAAHDAQRVENEVGSWFLDAGLTPQKFGVLIARTRRASRSALESSRRLPARNRGGGSSARRAERGLHIRLI